MIRVCFEKIKNIATDLIKFNANKIIVITFYNYLI